MLIRIQREKTQELLTILSLTKMELFYIQPTITAIPSFFGM